MMMCSKMTHLPLLLLSIMAAVAMTTATSSKANVNHFMSRFGKQVASYNNKMAHQDDQESDVFEYLNEHLEDPAEPQTPEADPLPSLIRKERALHKEDWALKINLVSFHNPDGHARAKRATYNTTRETWPHHIPYKFDESYPVELRPKVQRIMAEIMDHVCITWIEEPDFDPNNNDYPTNAYLRFVGSSSNICGTFLGQGDGDGPRNIKTCTQYYSITHELLHTLGMIHEQQGPFSLEHLTVFDDNVLSGYLGGTYKLHNKPDKIQTSEFDGSSIMMYSRRAFSKNGMDVMLPFRDEEFDINYDRRTSLNNGFMELNQVYKCREMFCNNANTDCGLGYYTRVKGVCQCVCPDGFDPAHNCRQLDDETSGPTQWPDVPFTLYATGVNECPTGFTSARFDITGKRTPVFLGDPFFGSGTTTLYYMCSRDASTSSSDMSVFPMGSYCFVKPADIMCNEGFEEGVYQTYSTLDMNSEGNVGDWHIFTSGPYQVAEMKFCCRADREWYYPIELPRNHPFRMISDNGQCPVIEGMRFEIGRIAMFNDGYTRTGAYPQSWLYPYYSYYYLMHSFCTYTPPTYGCNQNITMSSSNPSVEIQTPGFDAGQRDANRRCLYNFNIPKGSRVKVTFNTFDLDSADQFNVRRFNKWAKPLLDFDALAVPQFISEKDFLFLEWWSGKAASSFDGIHMTAELLEGDCFEDRGSNYGGGKHVTEMFEPCVPWKDATDCEDFPYSGLDAIELLTAHNTCRNPGGLMERPWCYVSVDRGMCRRAYCDVCNDLSDADRLSNCADLMAADPQFCTSALQRTKCAQSCGLGLNQGSSGGAGTCGTPTVPSDGSPTKPLKSSYIQGETVAFDCNLRIVNENPTEIPCTENGWPALSSACSECPVGWIPYGGRCFYYTPDERFVDFADAECVSMGARLFVINNATDVEVIRAFKQSSTIPNAYGASWVNIRLVDDQWVLYDNHSVPAPYYQWTFEATLDDPVHHGCAVMVWEGDTNGNAGKFLPTSCNLALSRTFCQMPRTQVTSCSDKSTFCAATLANDPGFCRRVDSYEVASLYCEMSCGSCIEEHVECLDPESNTYHVTSGGNVTEGDVMAFACNAGLYYISGDLVRACGTDGTLLGAEPVCSATPAMLDVGVSGVLRRRSYSPTNLIHLLDVDEFRIPFAGQVTHWHYYGVEAGNMYFVVYRKDLVTNNYQLVGYNMVTVGTLGERWTHAVPVASRITVMEGDVYGFFTIDGEIAATPCDSSSYPDKPMTLITQSADGVSDLPGDKAFVGTTCLIPSLGVRVVP